MIVRNVDTCPECGSNQVKICEKRVRNERVVRSRKCLTCRNRYKTVEVDAEILDENATNCQDFLYGMLNAGYNEQAIIGSLRAAMAKYREERENR